MKNLKLTSREQGIIENNLKAFNNYFLGVSIKKSGRSYFVFQNSNDFIYCCTNIHTLNGWLYGAIQAKNRIIV